MYDICIIGAGVVGSAIARELSKYQIKICLLEKDEDVATGATKANSGIVHGGYNEKHGSVKAKFSLAGNLLYKKLNDELHFGFSQIGSLLIGFNDTDRTEIEKIYANGIKNGVPNLQIVEKDFILKKEPYINPAVTCAIYSPNAGITSPYEFAIALAENAIQNGVQLFLNTKVTAIKQETDCFLITTQNTENESLDTIKSKRVINAAGLYSDEIAKMTGIHDFTINPVKGQYLLFDKDQGNIATSVIFQVPTLISKGVLVTPTHHGNLLIGPDATGVSQKNNLDTESANLQNVIEKARQSVPNFDLRKIITSFSGNRATPTTGDFIIEESSVKGFINVAGIESPGLTAAPAIAKYVVELVETSGINLKVKNDFNPERRAYKNVASLKENELQELIKKDPDYGKIICRCETISQGEIVDALRRQIPIKSIDAIKRRTRSGMGRCQSGFCLPKILAIIAKERKIPLEQLTKKGSNSLIVTGKTK